MSVSFTVVTAVVTFVGTHLWGMAGLRGFEPRGLFPNYSLLTQRQLPVKRRSCRSKCSFRTHLRLIWRMRDGEPGGVAWPIIVPNQPSSALGTVNSLPERHLATIAAESVSVSSSGKFPVLLSLVATTDERELQNPWRKAALIQDAQRL